MLISFHYFIYSIIHINNIYKLEIIKILTNVLNFSI